MLLLVSHQAQYFRISNHHFDTIFYTFLGTSSTIMFKIQTQALFMLSTSVFSFILPLSVLMIAIPAQLHNFFYAMLSYLPCKLCFLSYTVQVLSIYIFIIEFLICWAVEIIYLCGMYLSNRFCVGTTINVFFLTSTVFRSFPQCLRLSWRGWRMYLNGRQPWVATWLGMSSSRRSWETGYHRNWLRYVGLYNTLVEVQSVVGLMKLGCSRRRRFLNL